VFLLKENDMKKIVTTYTLTADEVEAALMQLFKEKYKELGEEFEATVVFTGHGGRRLMHQKPAAKIEMVEERP